MNEQAIRDRVSAVAKMIERSQDNTPGPRGFKSQAEMAAYHTDTDNIEQIGKAAIADLITLALHTMVRIADAAERLANVVEEDAKAEGLLPVKAQA
jgi:hypothetical protein